MKFMPCVEKVPILS